MKQWIIIVNVYAASKKAGLLWRRAERHMKKHGIAYQCCYTGTDGNACDLARKAAEQGYAKAQKKMARCYREGLGVPVDEEKAKYWEELYEKNPNK